MTVATKICTTNTSITPKHHTKHDFKGNGTSLGPSEFVLSTFKQNGAIISQERKRLAARFSTPTEAMIQSYNADIIDMVRRGDIDQIKDLHQDETVRCNSCNKFGESILHMACRLGKVDIVRYLVNDLEVDLYFKDDYGRTALHDAFWTIEPNFELVDFLLQKVPELLLVQDVRGHTPFDYARRKHWGSWLRFLHDRKEMLRPQGTQ
eukprot:Nitzschia sp. Nitz4//scaffold120_size68122//18476//19096//NITZ4_006040-RA/size68122-processed-gene-0.33-mRNA-1//1//CDS//3329534266//7616//frame0